MGLNSEIILYNSPSGEIQIQVKLEDETVWLTQEQMARLFGKAKSTINEHINNIYTEKELEQSQSMRKFGISEFSTKPTHFYNLDVIISVGYRVKSLQGTKFRQWATQRIKEYIVKGFAIDDNRLKQEGGRFRYFDELLQRIRDIRASERNFYQKVTDIYATAIDYQKASIFIMRRGLAVNIVWFLAYARGRRGGLSVEWTTPAIPPRLPLA